MSIPPSLKNLESAYQAYTRYNGCPEGKVPEELAKIKGTGPKRLKKS